MDMPDWIVEIEHKITEHFLGIKRAVERNHIEKLTIWIPASNSTDSSGNLSLPVYKVPDGKILILERLLLWMDGFDPDTVSTAGWVGIFHGPGANPGSMADFSPQSLGAQVFPSQAEYNHNNAPRFNGSDIVYAEFRGVVASTNVSVILQGCLEPEGNRS